MAREGGVELGGQGVGAFAGEFEAGADLLPGGDRAVHFAEPGRRGSWRGGKRNENRMQNLVPRTSCCLSDDKVLFLIKNWAVGLFLLNYAGWRVALLDCNALN